MAGRWKSAYGTCGAKRKYDGRPCEAMAMKRGGRCRYHGGAGISGPKTPEGKARALANLKQNRR